MSAVNVSCSCGSCRKSTFAKVSLLSKENKVHFMPFRNRDIVAQNIKESGEQLSVECL